ncbi:MAG: TolC family protein [Bacteroidetes bacterium]|nr:TolC family protein [Bacteroidota bacterium]MBS1980926.1 TolC family protein [Bacteroidota bacterium]
MAFVAVYFIFLQAVGQSVDTLKKVDIQTALTITKENYPAIKRKRAETEAANYELKAAKNNFLPNFIVQGQVLNSTSNSIRGAFYPNDGTALPVSAGLKVNGTTNDATWNSAATGLINWKFFNFGKLRAAVDVAKAGAVAAEADYQNELFQQQIKVSDAYFLSLMADDMLKSQSANLARVKALRDVTSAYAKSGIKPGVDSSLVNAEYSKATLQLLDAQRIAAEQSVYLKELMGLKNDNKIELDTIVYYTKQPQTLEMANEYANNPRLIYYKSIVDVNQAQIKAIKYSQYPSISFIGSGWARGSGVADKTLPDGGFIYNKSFSGGVGFRAYNWMVGVTTVWNFTSLFQTGNQARAQKHVATMAQERFNEETLHVESELERARLRYKTTLEAARQAPIQLKAAQDAYAQAKARYDAGLNSILELTQTFALLNRAEVDADFARGNVWRALIQYAAATGSLDSFTSNLN